MDRLKQSEIVVLAATALLAVAKYVLKFINYLATLRKGTTRRPAEGTA